MDLSDKIETYLSRVVDFRSEVLLVGRNIFDDDGNFIGVEDYISEWHVADVPRPTNEELDKIVEYINPRGAEEIRSKRDMLIAETDWSQMPDVVLSEEKREAYILYRQALRDITKQDGFPNKTIFPNFEDILATVEISKIKD